MTAKRAQMIIHCKAKAFELSVTALQNYSLIILDARAPETTKLFFFHFCVKIQSISILVCLLVPTGLFFDSLICFSSLSHSRALHFKHEMHNDKVCIYFLNCMCAVFFFTCAQAISSWFSHSNGK